MPTVWRPRCVLSAFVRGCTVADMDPSASIQDPPPPAVMADISSLVGELQSVPAKELDRNLLLATWNIREFGQLARVWDQPSGHKPLRDLHALRCIGEI